MLVPLFTVPLSLGGPPFILSVGSPVLTSPMGLGGVNRMQAIFVNPVARNAHTFGRQTTNEPCLIAVP